MYVCMCVYACMFIYVYVCDMLVCLNICVCMVCMLIHVFTYVYVCMYMYACDMLVYLNVYICMICMCVCMSVCLWMCVYMSVCVSVCDLCVYLNVYICMTKSLTDWLWQTDFQWISENGQLREASHPSIENKRLMVAPGPHLHLSRGCDRGTGAGSRSSSLCLWVPVGLRIKPAVVLSSGACLEGCQTQTLLRTGQAEAQN